MSVGSVVGLPVSGSTYDGVPVSSSVTGASVEFEVATNVGVLVGTPVGFPVVGSIVGIRVGVRVGFLVGFPVVGTTVGVSVCPSVGGTTGASDCGASFLAPVTLPRLSVVNSSWPA